MEYRAFVLVLAAAVLLSGCTALESGQGQHAVDTEPAVGESFLAKKSGEELVPVERNTFRPGEGFFFVLENVTGLESRRGNFSYRVDIEVLEVPEYKRIMYDARVVESNVSADMGVVDGIAVRMTAPEYVDFRSYVARAVLVDGFDGDNVTVGESVIVVREDGGSGDEVT